MREDPRPTILDAARFCPDCGRAVASSYGALLCEHCGGTLAIQGYCPICESRLRRRVGEACPKHDVELLPNETESSPGLPSSPGTSWVTVRRFPDSLAASAARIRLDAEGIPTFLEGERMGAPAMYRVATGGVKLQVPAELAADARILLSQSWAWPADDLDADDDPATDEGTSTPPEGPSPRSILTEVVVVLALAIPLVAALLSMLRAG